jgi:hypothetical protein
MNYLGSNSFCKAQRDIWQCACKIGLPDFPLVQYTKTGKMHQTTTKYLYKMVIPYIKYNKIYRTPVKHIKNSNLRPSKIYQNWNFWYENVPSGNPAKSLKSVFGCLTRLAFQILNLTVEEERRTLETFWCLIEAWKQGDQVPILPKVTNSWLHIFVFTNIWLCTYICVYEYLVTYICVYEYLVTYICIYKYLVTYICYYKYL